MTGANTLPEEALIEILAQALWVSCARNGIVPTPANAVWHDLEEAEQERWLRVAGSMVDVRDVITLTVSHTRVER